MSETMRPQTGDRVRLRLLEGRSEFHYGTGAAYAGRIATVGRVDPDRTCTVTVEGEFGERWVRFSEIEPVEALPPPLVEAILNAASHWPGTAAAVVAGHQQSNPAGRILAAAMAVGVDIASVLPKPRSFIVEFGSEVRMTIDAPDPEQARMQVRALVRPSVAFSIREAA